MGHFLAVTAFRTESIPAVVQTISDFMRTHEVTHEVLTTVPSPNDRTDAQIFAPADGWTVVLWPPYFNIHDFSLVRGIASSFTELISTIHVYDGDYWEHLAVLGARELHTFCSRPTYWEDEPSELERIAQYNPAPDDLAQAANVPIAALQPYLVDADSVSEEEKANEDDEFPLSDIWVFTDFWRRLGIRYPDVSTDPVTVIRLSRGFAERLPEG
jgi:hypothetical protein